LLWKNTSAGFINITVARPTDEFEALGITVYESPEKVDGYVAEGGAVSGTLVTRSVDALACGITTTFFD
jgi:hypothetical protein